MLYSKSIQNIPERRTRIQKTQEIKKSKTISHSSRNKKNNSKSCKHCACFISVRQHPCIPQEHTHFRRHRETQNLRLHTNCYYESFSGPWMGFWVLENWEIYLENYRVISKKGIAIAMTLTAQIIQYHHVLVFRKLHFLLQYLYG